MTGDMHKLLYLPIELAELLHATLGPLADTLERESHPWSPMVKKVLREYTDSRDRIMIHLHGSSVIPQIAHHTYLAAEKVCGMTSAAIREEEHFTRWSAEVNGETA